MEGRSTPRSPPTSSSARRPSRPTSPTSSPSSGYATACKPSLSPTAPGSWTATVSARACSAQSNGVAPTPSLPCGRGRARGDAAGARCGRVAAVTLADESGSAVRVPRWLHPGMATSLRQAMASVWYSVRAPSSSRQPPRISRSGRSCPRFSTRLCTCMNARTRSSRSWTVSMSFNAAPTNGASVLGRLPSFRAASRTHIAAWSQAKPFRSDDVPRGL